MILPTTHNAIARRRIRSLQIMLARITRKLVEHEADKPPAWVKVHALRAEKLALEFALDALGEPRVRVKRLETEDTEGGAP